MIPWRSTKFIYRLCLKGWRLMVYVYILGSVSSSKRTWNISVMWSTQVVWECNKSRWRLLQVFRIPRMWVGFALSWDWWTTTASMSMALMQWQSLWTCYWSWIRSGNGVMNRSKLLWSSRLGWLQLPSWGNLLKVSILATHWLEYVGTWNGVDTMWWWKEGVCGGLCELFEQCNRITL